LTRTASLDLRRLFEQASERERRRRTPGRRPSALTWEQRNRLRKSGEAGASLIGFASEDDWFDYRREHRAEFLRRIAHARAAFRDGRGMPLEKID
jgi:hypothetical protein